MKRLSKGLFLLLAVLVTSGCVRQTIHMDVKKDGSVTVTGVSAVASDLVSDGESMVSDTEELEKLGYKVEDYKEDDMVGVQVSKTYKLENISSSSSDVVHLETMFDDPKAFESQLRFQKVDDKTYKANFVLDTSEEYDESMSSYVSQIELSYSVTLPSKAKSHNADEVDGTTYTWNITYGEKKDISYEFSLDGSAESNSMLFWIGIVLIVVIVAVVIIVIVKKKGKGQPQNTANGMPYNYANQNPQQPMQMPATPVVPQGTPQTPSSSNGNVDNGQNLQQ